MGLNEVFEKVTGRNVAKFYQDVTFSDGDEIRISANTQEQLDEKVSIVRDWAKEFGKEKTFLLMDSIKQAVIAKQEEARKAKLEERKKGIALQEVEEKMIAEPEKAGVCLGCGRYIPEEESTDFCPECGGPMETYEVELDPASRRYKADEEKVAADRIIIRKQEQDAVKDKLKRMGRRMRGRS